MNKTAMLRGQFPHVLEMQVCCHYLKHSSFSHLIQSWKNVNIGIKGFNNSKKSYLQ